ncbi:CRIB domain-containing protein RIC5-like [Gossypium australe]|uniref:CRIB domain-containing protein RIC5-like n=1 Tax=Gossypium australe TaxID=47621 RepID=A0A5B6WIG6_9ROSI|nr:CRIB domain-containing protein RIC5-like [Gossypium australe]
MKGLLRGLKYISQIFEDEKEPEMQIGNPTDVKHVAHIGMDGPSANKPSWPPPAGNQDSLPPTSNEKQKKSRRKQSASIGSPGGGSPKVSEKKARRQRTSNLSMESTNRDSSSRERRNRRATEPSSQVVLPDIPKKSRQKKPKESCGSDRSPSPSRFEY